MLVPASLIGRRRAALPVSGGYANAPPPANFRRASGAKTCQPSANHHGCVTSVTHLLMLAPYPVATAQGTDLRGAWFPPRTYSAISQMATNPQD